MTEAQSTGGSTSGAKLPRLYPTGGTKAPPAYRAPSQAAFGDTDVSRAAPRNAAPQALHPLVTPSVNCDMALEW